MLGCSHKYPRSSRTGGPVGGKLPVNLQIGAYHPFMLYQLSAFSSYDNDEVQEYDYGLTPGVKSNPSHSLHCLRAGRPSTRCSSSTPLSFCPSSVNCHARIPVAITGTVEIAASSRLAASAKPRRFVHCVTRSNHRVRSVVYVMPSGRPVVTRDNAKSIRSMRVMFFTRSYTPAGVRGGPAAMTTLPRVAPCGCAPPRPPAVGAARGAAQ